MNYRLDSITEQLQAFIQTGFNEEDSGTSPFFVFRVTKNEVQTKMLPHPSSSVVKNMYMKIAKMTAMSDDTEMVGVAFEAFFKTTTNEEDLEQMVRDGIQDSPDECVMFMMQARSKDSFAGMGVIKEVDGVKKIVEWKDFNDSVTDGSMNVNFFD